MMEYAKCERCEKDSDTIYTNEHGEDTYLCSECDWQRSHRSIVIAGLLDETMRRLREEDAERRR